MWKRFLVWLLKFALKQLGENLDAETQKQIDDYNRRRVELEETENTAAIELGKLETDIAQLESERNLKNDESILLAIESEQLDRRLERIRNEKNKKLADIDNLDDNALLHSEL